MVKSHCMISGFKEPMEFVALWPTGLTYSDVFDMVWWVIL
jgi:hypothetical protein